MTMSDAEAWAQNPQHRWVYDKLRVLETQAYRGAPVGIEPEAYPVLVRPVVNLYGMSRRARIEAQQFDYEPGMMWTEMLSGRHVSTDAIVEAGSVRWTVQALGIKETPPSLRFAFWILGDAYDFEISVVTAWAAEHLSTYSGPLNIETIGGKVIDVHLRLSSDWIDAGCYESAPDVRRAIGVPFYCSIDTSSASLASITFGSDEKPQRQAFVVFSA